MLYLQGVGHGVASSSMIDSVSSPVFESVMWSRTPVYVMTA
jgi:hypothetical protein